MSSLPLLHTISYFSLLRGVHSPEQMIAAAKSAGYSAVCIADRNNLYGLPRILAAGRKHGIRVIIGAELTLTDGSLLLFADGDTGYHQLCTVLSIRNGSKSFTLKELLSVPHDRLRVATDNQTHFRILDGTCPVYFRLSRPRRLPQWVRECGCAVLVGPPVAFMSPEGFDTHRMLRAIAEHGKLSSLDPLTLLPEDAMLQPEKELRERFEVFDRALETTAGFTEILQPYRELQTLKMPRLHGEKEADELLHEKTYEGAVRRYGMIGDTIRNRIEYELDLISGKGFSDYFLIVDDIVKQSPRTCGRGSGAASIVAYSLGITNVDPIRYNLMFERFLNPGRTDPPDIDVDFAWDERDGVLDYVFERYGRNHAAMVATHQTCGARMAIREVARVYGMTEAEISTVTKKIPWFLDLPEYAENLEALLRKWPAFADVTFEHPWGEILRDAGKIIGLPRGIGTHCGGVIITEAPITSLVPVQTSAKGYPVIQWEKDGAEEMGLVKIDLLGNRSLAVIRDAVASVKAAGIDINEERWKPQDDPETRQLIAYGKTIGVFYVESPAMRLLQRKSCTGDFDSLVIHSSIIRPAANKFIRRYIERLHGQPWEPLHPLLAQPLAETYGIMVYQEDVAKVAMALAGFSSADADRLRKIVSKKSRGETFAEWKNRFFSGAVKNGVSEKIISAVWEMMESFSGYSFCKPHSASYVQVSFQSAWLKAHYPAHFMAAVLSNYGGFYTTQAYISEAMRLGIMIAPPGVNTSDRQFRAENMKIYVGLCQIKGLSLQAQDRIVGERKRNGTFSSVAEFLRRTGIHERDGEKLVLAGACDEINPHLGRPQLFWALRGWFRSGTDQKAPALGHISGEKFLLHQYEMLGFLTHCHPITLSGRRMKRPPLRAEDVDRCVGRHVSLFGWCVTSKTVTAKTGESMEFVTFEDETGIFETVFFPKVFRQFSLIIAWQMGFLLYGVVTEEFGVAVIEVRKIQRI